MIIEINIMIWIYRVMINEFCVNMYIYFIFKKKEINKNVLFIILGEIYYEVRCLVICCDIVGDFDIC